MHATTALGFAAVLGLVLAGSQEPQGREAVAVAAPMPRLADILKGYVGQECVINWGGDIGLEIGLSFDARARGECRKKLEIVGQDFVKLSDELIVPFSNLSIITGKKP